MSKIKTEARINACKISEYNDKTFADLYLNKGVEWFGEKYDLDILERRAKRLNLNKEKVK